MHVNAETFFAISAALLEKGVGDRSRDNPRCHHESKGVPEVLLLGSLFRFKATG